MQYKHLAAVFASHVLPAYEKAIEHCSELNKRDEVYDYLFLNDLNQGICHYLKENGFNDEYIVFNNSIKNVWLFSKPGIFYSKEFNLKTLKWRINYLKRYIKKHSNNTSKVRDYSLSKLPF